MNNFKVGNEVECINNSGSLFLNKGYTYTIKEIGADQVKLIGLESWYNQDKFKLIEVNKGTI